MTAFLYDYDRIEEAEIQKAMAAGPGSWIHVRAPLDNVIYEIPDRLEISADHELYNVNEEWE